MLNRLVIIFIAIAIPSSFFPARSHALSCVYMTPEEHAVQSDVILEGEVLAVVLADGTPYQRANGSFDQRAFMQVQVSQVWQGTANEFDVIEYTLLEWGEPYGIGETRIFFLNDANDTMVTSPCSLTLDANEEAYALMDAVSRDQGDLLPGQANLYTQQVSRPEESDSGLLPIVVGPVTSDGEQRPAHGPLVFNLLSLLALAIGLSGAYVAGRRKSAAKLANANPMK